MPLTTNRARREVAQAKRETPRPSLLCWCIRQALYESYGWRSPF